MRWCEAVHASICDWVGVGLLGAWGDVGGDDLSHVREKYLRQLAEAEKQHKEAVKKAVTAVQEEHHLQVAAEKKRPLELGEIYTRLGVQSPRIVVKGKARFGPAACSSPSTCSAWRPSS